MKESIPAITTSTGSQILKSNAKKPFLTKNSTHRGTDMAHQPMAILPNAMISPLGAIFVN
jgi:hypothetical protein